MIPTISDITKPLLQFAGETIDPYEISVLEAEIFLAKKFKLTKKERLLEKKSGKERLFLHRVRWSRTYLKKAGLIVDTKIGHFKITKLGYKIMDENPDKITESYLNKFKSFKDTRRNLKYVENTE